jgi:DNA-binding transcriptional ArsR family regulator
MALLSRTKSRDLAELEKKAGDAARLMRMLANEQRLLILCRLAAGGEMSVGELVEAGDLGQSALSQHLAKLREEGLVATRRDAQTIHYRIGDRRAARVLALLKDIYCP